MREADNRAKLHCIVEAALERHAHEPVALDVGALTSYADIIVVLSGNSSRQVRAIGDNVSKSLKAFGDAPIGLEGGGEGRWVLIDANDIIVHVFDGETRTLFDLEGLWSDAPRIDVEGIGDNEPASTRQA
jgi:ribosome-associated protein